MLICNKMIYCLFTVTRMYDFFILLTRSLTGYVYTPCPEKSAPAYIMQQICNFQTERDKIILAHKLE